MKKEQNTENKQLHQTPVSGSFKMTKNQKKHFIRIWIGSMVLYSDIGLDEVEQLDIDEFEKLEELKCIQAAKMLKNDSSSISTTEVFDYVIKNYR